LTLSLSLFLCHLQRVKWHFILKSTNALLPVMTLCLYQVLCESFVMGSNVQKLIDKHSDTRTYSRTWCVSLAFFIKHGNQTKYTDYMFIVITISIFGSR
jgi:hypothetical protein